jgi:hypothetical protein
MLNAIEDLRMPWSSNPREECPEDDAVGVPVQFEWAQPFLGKSYEEAVAEYHELWADHVSPEMAANTPILKLLAGKAQEVFIPTTWEGIVGLGELDFPFDVNMPSRMKPKARHSNPKMWEDAEKEFTRMRGYFYEETRSPWASCLVIAPKSTKPFIRICGDYVGVNKYIPTGHYYIPNVRYEIDKIINYPFYLDIDLTNAFHQIPLSLATSERLSVQTPWGQFRPKFLPEGVGPGSGVLQEFVRKIFSEFEWAIVIFDNNVLILASSPMDAYEKLDIFIDKCILHNVKLKFSKSWIGFRQVKFFGYDCSHKHMELSGARKDAIKQIPFPTEGNRTKKMRVALGCGVFFSPFVPNYSSEIKHLTDLSKASFNWDESTWKHDYKGEFESYKNALVASVALFYPDYSLQWIVRTDASEFGVGGMIIQVFIHPDGTKEEQMIAICSKKFSGAATRWCTIDQEAYGIFYVVEHFSYYLRGVKFTIETDHANLVWIEASMVPKIVRWRVYLQSFDFVIDHIKGKVIRHEV